MGIAAALLAGLALWGCIALSRRGSEFTTAVGEQRSITLSDGSLLFLNTNSQVRVQDIKVVNLWVNRLIGDKQPGATAVAFAPQSPYTASSPLRPSGLLGSVRILARDLKQVEFFR